jgi:hypothetical protein
MTCKFCSRKNNIFKITDFEKFKILYHSDPNILYHLDKNGFTFFQNILWSFSRERFKHSNKLLFNESVKALYYLLNTLDLLTLQKILSVESLNEPGFTTLHDYAKNILRYTDIDRKFIKKLEELGLQELLEKKDANDMNVYDYLKFNTPSKIKEIKEKQRQMKILEKRLIATIPLNKCEICNNPISVLNDIKNFKFLQEHIPIIKKIIESRKQITKMYNLQNNNHNYIISLWDEKLQQIL